MTQLEKAIDRLKKGTAVLDDFLLITKQCGDTVKMKGKGKDKCNKCFGSGYIYVYHKPGEEAKTAPCHCLRFSEE